MNNNSDTHTHTTKHSITEQRVAHVSLPPKLMLPWVTVTEQPALNLSTSSSAGLLVLALYINSEPSHCTT